MTEARAFPLALAGWFAFAAFVLLACVPIYEVLAGWHRVPWAMIALGVLMLLAWGLRLLLQKPRRNWPAPILVLLAASLWFGLSEPLLNAGLILNFARHQATYDRVVADAEAGLLKGKTTPSGAIEGVRNGQAFHAVPGPAGFVRFKEWQGGDYMFFDVFHDRRSCPGRDKGRPVHTPAQGARPPTLSVGYSLHLGGHYCLTHLIV